MIISGGAFTAFAAELPGEGTTVRPGRATWTTGFVLEALYSRALEHLGYLASKDEVEKYNITTIEDFKRPEVKKAFDANGDGKADLVACPPGWGCTDTIAFHMKAYDMKEHVNLIKAGYAAGMADAVSRYNAGEPVFFYTWTPNWTVNKLKPGKDVMWIGVPEIIPRPAQKGMEDALYIVRTAPAILDRLFMEEDICSAIFEEYPLKTFGTGWPGA